MRITAFIQSLGLGGAESVLVTVMNFYKSLGHDITVVANTLNGDVNSQKLVKEIKIQELGCVSAKEAIGRHIEYVRHHEFEVAFCFSPEIAVNLYWAKRICRNKYRIIGRCINTLSYEFDYSDKIFRKYITKAIIKVFYHKIDLVVAQAENMRRDLIDNFNMKDNQVITINNPLAEKYEKECLSDEYYEKEDFILFVGRYEKQKGLDMLLDAYAQTNHGKTKLYLVGKGTLQGELEDMCRKLKIDKDVLFVRFTQEIEKYYKKAKLVILSSYYEGFPNVLIEAIACGTPVISFDLPSGPKDIIIDGVNGFLAKYLDVNDLSKRITDGLNKEWDYLAIKKTAKNFFRDYILEKYEKILEN